MAKIVVLVLSGPEATFRVASGLGFAAVAHDQGAEVRVIFFADGVRVPLELDRYPELKARMEALKERGLLPAVCRRNLEVLGQPTELPGYDVHYIGQDLVRASEEGFTVLSF